jgi:serine/threonine protein kinase
MVELKIDSVSATSTFDFKLPPEYELIKLVGYGSFGCVARAMHIPTTKVVAIKQIKRIFDSKLFSI